MPKLAILSDTHGLLRPEVLTILRACDVILHGGDINKREIINELQSIAPTYVVQGNNDAAWSMDLPLHREMELFGLHIYMTHKKKDLPKDLSDFDLVIYGHSHKYEERSEGETVLLNPGSCGPRRFDQEITMAVVEMGENDAADLRRAGDNAAEKECAYTDWPDMDHGGKNMMPAGIKNKKMRITKIVIPH